MAERPVGVSPDVQSILQDVAIAEAQRRLTLGQQMAAREQALRQARQLRGADVLRAMARDVQMAESKDVALQQIAMQRALMEEQRKAQLLSGLAGAAGAGLVAGGAISDASDAAKVAQPGEADFVGPLPPPDLAEKTAAAQQRAKEFFELGKLEAQLAEDPYEAMRIRRQYNQMAAAEGLF
jgi:hypothetical protein